MEATLIIRIGHGANDTNTHTHTHMRIHTLVGLVQGLPFSEHYESTPQIQVENIQWLYNGKLHVEMSA